MPDARTTAHAALKKNLRRARYFLDIHEATQEGAGAPDNKRRELPRGAVVFAVGALDSYLSEVSAEVMLAQFEAGALTGSSRVVLKAVVQNSPTLAIEAALAGNEVDRRELVRTAITEHFYGQVSNHGAKAVAAAVERMGGSVNAVWTRTEALGETSAPADLDEWTDKRHRIVHRGEAPTVNREPARGCVSLIERIGLAVDEVAMTVIAPPAQD